MTKTKETVFVARMDRQFKTAFGLLSLRRRMSMSDIFREWLEKELQSEGIVTSVDAETACVAHIEKIN